MAALRGRHRVVAATRIRLDLPVANPAPDAVTLELGTGPLARTLRRLGLPRPADSVIRAEGSPAVIDPP